MKTALFADIHGNREAFAACLAHVKRHPFDRMMVLGDIVGYGADPSWCVDTVREITGQGGLALLGNHDEAVAEAHPDMNQDALAAIEWTRRQLDDGQRHFLRNLPLLTEEGETLFVHSSAAAPHAWNYITGPRDADACLRYTTRRIVICGHVHRPQIFHAMDRRPIEAFAPAHGAPIPLLRQRRWVAVLGSVGQPRDGNPAAAYAIFDSVQSTLTLYRVAYDIDAAAQKIRAAGLPERLASRLFAGR